MLIVEINNSTDVETEHVVIAASDTQSDGGEDSPISPDTNQTHRLSSPDTNQTPDIVRTSLYQRNNMSGMIL